MRRGNWIPAMDPTAKNLVLRCDTQLGTKFESIQSQVHIRLHIHPCWHDHVSTSMWPCTMQQHKIRLTQVSPQPPLPWFADWSVPTRAYCREYSLLLCPPPQFLLHHLHDGWPLASHPGTRCGNSGSATFPSAGCGMSVLIRPPLLTTFGSSLNTPRSTDKRFLVTTYTVEAKLVLYCTDVTLYPLLVKVTSFCWFVIHFLMQRLCSSD
jgi:hypothetical protein